jgi:NAD(P)-dependent dehydrogenase (short-subunit alcohol dehydrogenase family)
MTVEERLAVLEERLRRAEDELAIARLMASNLDIAPVALFLAGEGCRYLTSNTLFVDGGSHINGVAWTPDLDAKP